LARVFQQRVVQIRDPVDTHHLDRDGSHALAKKGGEAVAYQGRKKAKPSKVLPLTAANGFILASTGSIAGHHHDAFDLKDNLRAACKFINGLGISIAGRYFNADAAFNTQAARWTCFNPKGIPTIAENKPARKKVKRAPNGGLMQPSIRCASAANAPLPGLTSSGPGWFGLTAARPILWALISSFTP